jgi:hypothetical protein
MARAILERLRATGEIARQQYEKLSQELGGDGAKSNNSERRLSEAPGRWASCAIPELAAA